MGQDHIVVRANIMDTRPFHGVQWLGHGTDQQPQFSATIY